MHFWCERANGWERGGAERERERKRDSGEWTRCKQNMQVYLYCMHNAIDSIACAAQCAIGHRLCVCSVIMDIAKTIKLLAFSMLLYSGGIKCPTFVVFSILTEPNWNSKMFIACYDGNWEQWFNIEVAVFVRNYRSFNFTGLFPLSVSSAIHSKPSWASEQ